MPRRALRTALLAASTALGATAAHAQQPPSILDLADGRRIYVFGLRRWTVSMLQDSLAKYSPADSLQSHACAGKLRYTLHFADASAETLNMGDGRPHIIAVSVREPQDSARVKYRLMPLDTTAPRPEWTFISRLQATDPAAFFDGARAFLGDTSAAHDSAAMAVRDWLVTFPTQHRMADAVSTLKTSRNYRDRQTAAILLAHSPDVQATWSLLLDAMRESDGPVKAAAVRTLASVATRSRRAPNWGPLAPSINAILDGTSLMLMAGFIDILLSRPELGPAMATPFLRGGGEMLVNYAASDHPIYGHRAHALLVKLRGSDLGRNPEPWRKWIASLR
jgi:hypothetical protein